MFVLHQVTLNEVFCLKNNLCESGQQSDIESNWWVKLFFIEKIDFFLILKLYHVYSYTYY